MDRRAFLFAGSAIVLSGCTGSFQVDYERELDPTETRGWKLAEVVVFVPDSLSVSNANSLAPNADIVWHGEAFGDRRAQVAAILEEAVSWGAAELNGKTPVVIAVELERFHAVTPIAISRALSAVHSIHFSVEVQDARTGRSLTERHQIVADLRAYVGAGAVLAAKNGDTQKSRIVNHVAAVTRGWLGLGPDPRHNFSSIGR